MTTTAFDWGNELADIRTEVPGPRSRTLAQELSQTEAPNASVMAAGDTPVFWDRTLGANIWDADGNRYVDLTAGFCVAVAGHSNPAIVAAIQAQAARMMHSQGGANPNPLRVDLTRRLTALCPPGLTVAHIVSTGGEAVEMALKTARLATGKQMVLAFHGGFHGKLLGALSVTSQNYYRAPFMGVIAGTTHLPYAYCYRCAFGKCYPECDTFCADYVRYVLEMPDSGIANVAAIIVEPAQGHGGWIVPPPEFLTKLRALCDEKGILLIADEIITGFGRTGRMFGVMRAGITPDILVVGKGLASGFPVAAAIMRPELARAWGSMQHTSTFMGHPIGCAASLACLDEIERHGLVARSMEIGTRMMDALKQMQPRHPLMGDVRGIGSMVGIEFVRDRKSKAPAAREGKRVVQALLSAGVMATNYGGTYHNVLKMSPPLTISDAQLDFALARLDQCIGQIEREEGMC
ncbi:MAG: aspartate aminotransferase family protein [Anaerolineae bacterium]